GGGALGGGWGPRKSVALAVITSGVMDQRRRPERVAREVRWLGATIVQQLADESELLEGVVPRSESAEGHAPPRAEVDLDVRTPPANGCEALIRDFQRARVSPGLVIAPRAHAVEITDLDDVRDTVNDLGTLVQ